MIVYFLYAPLALASSVLLCYSARGVLRGHGKGRLAPIALVLSASLFGSLYLMFGIDERSSRWAAVASVRVVAVPITLPVAGMMFPVVYTKLTDQPMWWN